MAPPFELDLSPISEETRIIAEKELFETPENVEKGLRELKELLKNDKTMHYKYDDDDFLITFLRPCKFYAQSAHALLRRMAEFKEAHKKLVGGLLPEHEKEAIMNHDVVNVLVDRDHLGRRILLVNSGGTWNPSAVTADQLFRIFYVIHQVALLEPESQVRGCVVIMDFKNLSMKQITALSPSVSKRLLTFIQDAMAVRLKEIHVVNQPFIFKMVWAIFKPFIKEKLSKRIHFHGSDMKSLHKFMEPRLLPSDFGGELHKIDYTAAKWYPAVEAQTDYLREMDSFGLVGKK